MKNKSRKPNDNFVGMSEYGPGDTHAPPTGPMKTAKQIDKEKRDFAKKQEQAKKAEKSGKPLQLIKKD